MKLYLGGAYQGQRELAALENPGKNIIEDFHVLIWEAARQGQDPACFANAFCDAHPDVIITADEVGCGIIPIEPALRQYREVVGGGMCIVAQRAECVIRVFCGIGVRIK